MRPDDGAPGDTPHSREPSACDITISSSILSTLKNFFSRFKSSRGTPLQNTMNKIVNAHVEYHVQCMAHRSVRQERLEQAQEAAPHPGAVRQHAATHVTHARHAGNPQVTENTHKTNSSA